jgi:hypothetical protein
MAKRALFYALALLAVAPLTAQEPLNAEINAKIRQEEASHSQIMRTLHMFTDVYGPRVTGSPNHKAAAEWALKQMAGWGLTNGHLEPWDFGHPGWVNERFSAHIIAPVKDQLTCEVVAWTPGTNGPVTARAYHLIVPDRPTADQLTAFLGGMADKVKGQIVLVGKSVAVPVNLNPPAKRRPDEEARAQYDPNNPDGGRGRGRGRGNAADTPPGTLSTNEINRRLDEFLVANGARVRVNDAGREHGQIIAFNNRTFDVTKRCRPSSCGTRTTAASRASSRMERRSSSSSTSTTRCTRKGGRRTTPSRRFPAATRKTKS